MYWLNLAFISVFTLSVSNILQRALLKDQKSNSISYALVFQFICALLVFTFALIQGFVLPPIAELWAKDKQIGQVMIQNTELNPTF